MVAELLARSPENILGTLYPSAMIATPGASPGEFVDTGVRNLQTMEINVGDTIVKIGIMDAGMLLGASALNEAKDAVVEKLTDVFGKYQAKTVDALEDLDEIHQNPFDGTPDENKQTATQQTNEDVAINSVSFKTAMFDALASNQTIRATETTVKQKQASTDELTEEQQVKVQKFINEVMDAQLEKHKVELQHVVEQCRQQNLDAETTRRQRDTALAAMRREETDKDKGEDPLFHSWPGQSPGPEVMQRTAGAPPERTPLEKRIDTPDNTWEELLTEQVNKWVGYVQSNGKLAPKKNVVENRVVHYFRDLVEHALAGKKIMRSRFNRIRKGDKTLDTPKDKIVKQVYSPSSGGDTGGGHSGGSINNLGRGNGGDGPRDPRDEDPDGDNDGYNTTCNGRYDDRIDRKFQFVNHRNINIVQFSGRNLTSNPYLPFNNSLRRLILVQGKAGDEVLEILDDVDKMGAEKFIKEDLEELAEDHPKAYEYDRAIKFALLNFIIGLAHGRVKYGVKVDWTRGENYISANHLGTRAHVPQAGGRAGCG